jgi:hypothetical protein
MFFIGGDSERFPNRVISADEIRNNMRNETGENDSINEKHFFHPTNAAIKMNGFQNVIDGPVHRPKDFEKKKKIAECMLTMINKYCTCSYHANCSSM